MLNSSERSNSVFWSLRSVLRERAVNPNSLMTITFSLLELGFVSAARPGNLCLPKTHSNCFQIISQFPADRNYFAMFWQALRSSCENGQCCRNVYSGTRGQGFKVYPVSPARKSVTFNINSPNKRKIKIPC